MVVGVVVVMANGRGGCGWCCGYFLGSGIYYLLWRIYYFVVIEFVCLFVLFFVFCFFFKCIFIWVWWLW